MDDFVAYPSPRQIGRLILIAVGFVIVGLWLGGVFGPPPNSGRYSPTVLIGIGWLSVAFFGLGGLFLCRQLFDRRERVRIGAAGVRSAQWSDQTIPWSEIADVTTWSHKGQHMIILHLRERRRFPGRGLAATFAVLNRGLTGGDIAISMTGTDRRFEDALSAMDRFRGAGEAGAP